MEGGSLDFGDSPIPAGSIKPGDLQEALHPQIAETIRDPSLQASGNDTGRHFRGNVPNHKVLGILML